MIVEDDFIFRSGQYAGKTYGWVKSNNPSYITWVELNKPQMLRPSMNQKYQPKPQPEVKQPRKEPPPDDQVVPKRHLKRTGIF